MAYNKAREEKKWRLWKEAEEKQLRSLGVSEDTIEQLRVHDWAIFNSDRRYYQRMQETGTYLEEVAEDTTPPEIKTVEDFLDSIFNKLVKICTCFLHTLIVPPIGIENRPIVNSEMFYGILTDTQTPQMFFLGFFPEPPFLFFSGFVVSLPSQ